MFGVVTLLCAVAAVTFCAGANGRISLIPATVGYILATFLFLTPPLLPSLSFPSFSLVVQPTQLAVVLAMVAGYGLLSPHRSRVLMAFGGIAAAYWTAMLAGQGIPLALAIAGPVLVSFASALCTLCRPGFASPQLRDEALVIVMVLALAQAIVPTVMDAWRSAAVFQDAALTHDNGRETLLVLTLMALFFVLGALYQGWILKRWIAKR